MNSPAPTCPIEFHTSPTLLERIPHPYPAGRHVPEWFKQMPADFQQGETQSGTMERCPPLLLAMGAGYIIPAPFDARFVMNDRGELTLLGSVNFFSTHFPAQYAGAPFTSCRVVKFENPWVIVTPPDYVCLITAPLNRFEMPFTPLTGIVETGTYYREIHLPMACAMQPGQEFKLLRGSPMIQVIPLRREEWASRVGPLDPARRDQQEAMFKSDPHFYKEQFWRKMQFS